MAQTEKAVIISLTETHLKEDINDAEVQIPNYQLFRTDRQADRKKGGVATYVSNFLAAQTDILFSESNSYVELQMLYIRYLNMVYINIYRPPDCPTIKFIEQFNKLQNIIHNLPAPMPTITLTGDLNFPLINWESESVYGGSNEMRRQAEALLHLAEDLCLLQCIDVPTRSDNILDVVMTNDTDLIHETEVHETNLSDHNIIMVTTKIPFKKKTTLSSPVNGTLNFNQLNFLSESTNWESLKQDLRVVDWSVMANDDPSKQYQMITNMCLKISLKHVPFRKPPRKLNIPKDRKLLMRKRTKLRKKLKNMKNTQPKNLVEKKIIDIEKRLRKSVDAEREREETQAVSCIKNNPKFFYKYAAKKSKVQTNIGPLKDSNGKLICEPERIAEALNQHYQRVYSEPQTNQIVEAPEKLFEDNANSYNLTDIDITELDIENAIKEIAINSSAGPDQFPAVLVKNCAKELSFPLLMMYRNSLHTGIIPQPLKNARITPVYKGKSKYEAKNYRPIALTSHIIKILEKIIVKHIKTYLENNNKINKDQHGFRAGRSCLSQLLAHYEKILEALEHDKSADVVHLDFSAAFDKVDHGILLHKIRQLGISGRLGVWLHSFLTGREQHVAVDGAVSAASMVVSGVPQGTVVGPLLFLIHINDINEYIQYSSVASFADDTRIMKEITSPVDSEMLQNDLSSLYDWAKNNNMSFNNNKFEHISYSKKSNISCTHYLAQDGSPIETTQYVRDLGVTFSSDCSFSVHIINASKKARMQTGWILRTFRTRQIIPMMTLYKSLVLPLLEYCCQLWSPWKIQDKQSLEAVQRSFTAKISEVKELNYWERLKSLDLFSLERRRERYTIIYVHKILTGSAVNNLDLKFSIHPRLGRLCNIRKSHPRATTSVKTLKENSFVSRGPKLYNSLPKYLRDTNYTSHEKFKHALDKFLKTIPDQPKLPHYHLRATSNSITDQLALRRADGEYH